MATTAAASAVPITSVSGADALSTLPSQASIEKAEAQSFLSSLLNKKLRLHTTDGRMFWGEFKCTDPDRNIVLAYTYEYREPSAEQLAAAAEKSAVAGAKTVKMKMTHRYLGLVVVPGEHVVKIEKEEFASQTRKAY